MFASSTASRQRFALRHVQLFRAVIAALAAVMITFSPDHSAAVGLSVFSGFGIASALVFFGAAWLTFPAGRRSAAATMGALSLVAGMCAGLVPLRSTTLFFSVVIAWALATGAVELFAGLRNRRGEAKERSGARDGVTLGIVTLLVGVALLLVPAQYALHYTIAEAGATFTLTGTTIAVGVFGGYAAIIAVYLAIAGFSPDAAASASGADRRDAAEDAAKDAAMPVRAEGVL